MPARTSRDSSIYLPALGAALFALAQLRWGIAPLAWVAPVPFLRFLRLHAGATARLHVLGALYLGSSVATLKIATEPLPWSFAFLWALPLAFFFGAAYLLWDLVRRRTGDSLAALSFAALMVFAEYVQHRFTPFGSWGSAANTQLELLPLMQVASLFGLAGVSFLVYFVAASLELWISRGARAPLFVAGAMVVAAFGFGALRLELARTGETTLVAAVGTDGTFNGWPLPSDAELARVNDGLFERTRKAAAAGAHIVAWNEAATLVKPHTEAAFVERVRAAAKAQAITLVAAYIVPLPGDATYENKYVWATPEGMIDHTYFKHEPVPGEPAIRGTSEPKVVQTAAGAATGALCYDYDFPKLGLSHARRGIDLAIVPSSDWRGIDPLHTQMASVRAIEGGFSLLRSTRYGLSAGFDAFGRARAWQSSFDSKERVLLVALPTARVATLYARIGDALPIACAAFVLLAFCAPLLTRVRGARRTTSPNLDAGSETPCESY